MITSFEFCMTHGKVEFHLLWCNESEQAKELVDILQVFGIPDKCEPSEQLENLGQLACRYSSLESNLRIPAAPPPPIESNP